MDKNNKPNFGKAAAWMLVATIILSLGFVRLYKNQKPYLDEVGRLQETGHSLNLGIETQAQSLADLLIEESILTDPNDANATASHIVRLLANSRRNSFKNLGSLYSTANSFPSAYADTAGGEQMQARVMASKVLLGINDEYLGWLEEDNECTFFQESDSAACHIIAKVQDEEGKNGIQDVPVRLK